jgi:hypothetical protein
MGGAKGMKNILINIPLKYSIYGKTLSDSILKYSTGNG